MEEQEGWKKQPVRYLPTFQPSNPYEETKHKFDIETCLRILAQRPRINQNNFGENVSYRKVLNASQ